MLLTSKEEPSQIPSEADVQQIQRIVDKHNGERAGLIATLEEIQAEVGYLPETVLKIVAERTGRSLVEVFGVASFYNLFSLTPRGKHLTSVCLGTACHVRGSPAVLEEVRKQLGVGVGETTPDRSFTLKTVNCLGACALGPVMVCDGRYFSKVKRSAVKSILEKTRNGVGAGSAPHDSSFTVTVSCPFCNHSLMDNSFYIEGNPSIRVTATFGDKHGWVRLSSIYGDFNVYAEHEIPLQTVVHFFCPHCHAELISSWTCSVCSAPMVQLIVQGGGTVRICSRRGCNGSESHMLDLP